MSSTLWSGPPHPPRVSVFGLLHALVRYVSVLSHRFLLILLLFQVMTDPDAPSPSEPSMREWVHWSVRSPLFHMYIVFRLFRSYRVILTVINLPI